MNVAYAILRRLRVNIMYIGLKITFTALCLTAGLMCSTSAFAQAGPWLVSEKNGEVSIGQSGVTKSAIKGSALRVGDTVKTGIKGRVVLTRGEQYMVVAPNSHIRIANPQHDGPLTQVFSYLGSVLFKVDKRKTQHFEVKTPYMAAVVKGTTFNVVVGPEGSTVQVTEGAVEVATLDGGAIELLTPGNIGMVGSSDLFALNVLGDVNKVINSPNGQAAPNNINRPAEPTQTKATVSDAPVVKEIRDNPVNLGKLTNGLITNAPITDTASTPRKVTVNNRPNNGNAVPNLENDGDTNGNGNSNNGDGRADFDDDFNGSGNNRNRNSNR